ncbi:MAG: BatA domain-containing protein [Candidatus Methanoperedens sp.]|nr:BatA domain-containing protein [Candidatus Methanoperedens sp.]MCZ7404040.1 BatA domain-containing protein [Candidatus Methanoperedens sp.]
MSLLDTYFANPVQFANQAGLYALLSIIPLIIIYLLRPRPKKLKIPSLMFLFDLEKKKRLNIFRKFLKDPLFFIQLLVLILVSLAVAAPFIMANQEAGGGSTVVILDASGSMQAKTASGNTKFESAVDEAQKFLSAKNTIILAESVPLMVMQDAPSGSASDALKKLKAKATSVDLSSAILLGRRILPEGGRIVVLSDFTSWIGDDPSVAKALAESNGINVNFVTISGRTDNIGIVNGWFESSGDYTIVIKNFNTQAQDVKIDVTTDNRNVLSNTLNLKGQGSQNFAISNLTGTTKIALGADDALPLDNNAYVIIPTSVKHDLLYITDNVKSPSVVALGLTPFTKVKKTDTKNIPSMPDYSIVFVSSTLPPDAMQSLSDYVKGGGNAVIIASPGLNDTELLPVTLDSLSNGTSLNIVLPTMITNGIAIDKINVKKHFNATLKRGAVSLVEGGDNTVMLAYWKFGKGMVVYSGLADPMGDNIYDPLNKNIWNDFHSHADYPLFWKQMLEWISGSLDVSEYNANTGQFIKLPATQTVKTPGDTVTTDLLLLDEVGIYGLPDKNVAVNLYDETESNLAPAGLTPAANPTSTNAIPYNVQVIRKPEYLDVYLIIAGMFLVFLELYYLRWRGEL